MLDYTGGGDADRVLRRLVRQAAHRRRRAERRPAPLRRVGRNNLCTGCAPSSAGHGDARPARPATTAASATSAIRRLQQHHRPVARPDRPRARHQPGPVARTSVAYLRHQQCTERRVPARAQHRRLHGLGRRHRLRRAGLLASGTEEGDDGRARRRGAGSSGTSTATARSPATARATPTRRGWRPRRCPRPAATRPPPRPARSCARCRSAAAASPPTAVASATPRPDGDPVRATTRPCLRWPESACRGHQGGRLAQPAPPGLLLGMSRHEHQHGSPEPT